MSLPLGVEIFLTAVLSIIICVAIIGNSMVCLAISRSRTLRSQVANVFIVNLAITDLGCASLVMPFSLVSVWFDHWVFGGFLCDVACFFNYCFIIVSMLSLALISVDRHIYVVHPFKYQALMTHRRAIMLVLCTWFVGFIFAAAPPIMRWVIFDNAEIICAVNWESDHRQILAYTTSAFVICFASPIMVMLYCYVGIYKVAKEHAKRIAPPQIVGRICETEPPQEAAECREQSPDLTSVELNEDEPNYTQQDIQTNGKTSTLASQNTKKQSTLKPKSSGFYSNKAIRSILVMILAYIICNTPFSLTKLIKVIKISNEAVPFYINTAASWFGFINPCCNPIIYSILREDFRNAFIRLLPRTISKRFNNDPEGQSMRSQIIGNSQRFATGIRANVTVNIINPSPSKRSSPALIENPLHYDDDYNENMNVNHAVEATIDDVDGDHQTRYEQKNDGIEPDGTIVIRSAPLVTGESSRCSDDEGYTGSQNTSNRQSEDSYASSFSWRRSSFVEMHNAKLYDSSSFTTTVSV
ncbi:D(1) dopamine receptor-like [Lytechinus variegatus]|uniref:D(1) dopamine receptor-like n=1 Tax=Lytechinus variegatus TaxID=7654 RepID=UPI001BB22B19|nr:D(1) dopamine receptor-like [Lytechinus variegatus]